MPHGVETEAVNVPEPDPLALTVTLLFVFEPEILMVPDTDHTTEEPGARGIEYDSELQRLAEPVIFEHKCGIV
ncbi:MAG TPA: hypothetical protein VNI52_05385 [Sphingobacteriaceae bacterium]|nr:hypothetical protein [Sphingobacteriaceae bacterium]